MKCKVCGTEFEGNNCPACATPVTENKIQLYFYKDPWFWVSVLLFVCLVFNPIKTHIDTADSNKKSVSDFADTVSVFLADSEPDKSLDESTLKASSLVDSQPSSNANSEKVSSKADITDSTVVYITPSGKRYHLSAACAGKNKIPTTVKKATEKGKTPCQSCAK